MVSITEHKARMLNMAKRMTQKDAEYLGFLLNDAEHWSLRLVGGKKNMDRIFQNFTNIVFFLLDTNRLSIADTERLLSYRANFETFCNNVWHEEFDANDAQGLA